MMKYEYSDDTQVYHKITNKNFELAEVRLFSREPDEYIVVKGEIDIDDYNTDEINNCLQGYGYDDYNAVISAYGKDTAPQILAECLFEQTPEIELICFGPFDNEDKAADWLEDHIVQELPIESEEEMEID